MMSNSDARKRLAESVARLEAHDQVAPSALVEALTSITTHNGRPLSPTNLRWAATHEALCRSFIFDVLMRLADALEAHFTPPGEGGA